jgi:quercetin dioxygenase-like cupin family protein
MTAPHPAALLLRPARPPLAPSTLCDIATGLARSAPFWWDRLPALAHQRSGLRLLNTADYDAWLLRWPPGTRVTPHDHGGSVGAFTVVRGELTEIRWSRDLRGARRVFAGEVVRIGQGVVHDVVASGAEPSVSVHVYAPPLATMGYYDDEGVELLDRRPVDATVGALSDTRSLHPSGP